MTMNQSSLFLWVVQSEQTRSSQKNPIDQFERNRKKESQKGILRSKCYFSYLSFTEYINFSERYLSKLAALKSKSMICWL